jgi:hypothetical protein
LKLPQGCAETGKGKKNGRYNQVNSRTCQCNNKFFSWFFGHRFKFGNTPDWQNGYIAGLNIKLLGGN